MMRFENVKVGEVTLNVALAGDSRRNPVICLHGFPEYWAAWEQVAELLSRDFFVIMPDQRGYNLSERPQAVEDYRMKHLVADLDGLARHFLGDRPFVLAGHDWGASVAYAYAFGRPERLSHLVIANGVHPACFQRAILDDPDQRQASQYINWLRRDDAERRLAEDDFRRLFKMLEGFSSARWMGSKERDACRAAWSRDGALTAMLNWYRASPILVPEPGVVVETAPILDVAEADLQVKMPHLVLWGTDDTALRPSCIDGLGRYAPALDIRRIEGTGHWILHEKPAEVATAISAFVT